VTVIIVIVCAVAVLVAVLLAAMVAGMRREPPASELSTRAPSLTAAIVRRALGVSVRKPDTGEHTRETCLTGQGSSGWLEGRDQ
jgi:hypothetical protein